jgi:hypothetical protein
MTVTAYLKRLQALFWIAASVIVIAVVVDDFFFKWRPHVGPDGGSWVEWLPFDAMLLVVLTMLGAVVASRCPFCKRRLFPGTLTKGGQRWARCPYSRESFNRPMPGKAS